jgi:hypothetical protein
MQCSIVIILIKITRSRKIKGVFMRYKITGIFYTKPRLIHSADGEVHAARVGIWVDVGQPADFNSIGQKRVTAIEYDEDNRLFKVYFDKGGMRTIPLSSDTEITYEEINEKQQNKVNKG